MKTLYSVVLTLLCLMLFTTGCYPVENSEPSALEFSYEIENTVFVPGDQVSICVTAVNTGKSFYWKGTPTNEFFKAKLTNNSDDASFSVETYNRVMTDDATMRQYDTGARFTGVYSFEIPQNALTGFYDLSFQFMGVEKTFYDVLRIENDS